ncbi:hypothetical protein [Fundidesulfovibrio terrae]|uniref:hypothetical protein n=1 Tax=Fundidesulfovibrio terrae TaxID=2922866 RepID=UPI001FB013F1|nr:hypothetical protein [Fundidesulfovibrio terrae]
MIRFVLIAAVTAIAVLPGTVGPALAQQRVTSNTLQELKNKLDEQRNAYYRIELAEREALKDDSPERASVYQQAKNKAYEAYLALNAQLQQAQMEKRVQDARQAQQNPDYR